MTGSPMSRVAVGLSVFLGAFLLFQVQPIVGKRLLPWYGGTASVWTTCLLFFQVLLLAGYAYAHLSVRRLSPRGQAALHVALLVAACLVPVLPGDAWKPAGDEAPTPRILTALGASVGLRFFVLAATAPLLQAWYARIAPGRSPYRLYALSNAGSMLALVSYPLLVEAWWPLRRQAGIWSTGFFAFVAVGALVAWIVGGRPSAAPDPAPGAAPASVRPTRWRFVQWTAWAACGVVLFMSVTNQLTINMASSPLIWIVPLAVYLLTFIVTFGSPRAYSRKVFSGLTALALLGLYPAVFGVVGLGDRVWIRLDWTEQFVLLIAALAVLCTVCHGELYRLRPPADRLTSFYLALSLGGVIGGAFVALAAPRFFLLSQELHFGILLCLALWLATVATDGESRLRGFRPRPVWALLVVACLLPVGPLVYQTRLLLENVVVAERNYYGLLRVLRLEGVDGGDHLRLYHGSTLHGSQYLDPTLRDRPTAYYSPLGGGGAVLQLTSGGAGRRIGVVGLGVGTLATYGEPGDTFRFYEIDPAVERVARERFTFLADSAARTEVVLGDARLSLERESPQGFDVLVLDAFSSDAIPVHLLTTEAFDEYARHLADGGVIAVHVSNREVDLTPVVYRLAEAHDLYALDIAGRRGQPERLVSKSDWMILTRNGDLLDRLVALFRPLQDRGEVALFVGDPDRFHEVPLWTDDYSNVFRILERR